MVCAGLRVLGLAFFCLAAVPPRALTDFLDTGLCLTDSSGTGLGLSVFFKYRFGPH